MAKSHYTLRVDVTHSDHSDKTANTRALTGSEEKRAVRQVSSFVIRADSIDQLKDRASKHIDLLEDFNNAT